MSFLDEVDSLRSKLHLSSINPFMLIGLMLILVVVVGFAVYSASSFFMNGFSSDDNNALVIEKNNSSGNEETNTDSLKPKTLFVHVDGAVVNPGLYELAEGSRVKDAIDAAGGLKEDADLDSINLAEQLGDGVHLVVSTTQTQDTNTGLASDTKAQSSGKVNINSASVSELKSLDGVGDATAQKIVDYRQNQGRFTKIEDLKNVSGIGDKKYESLKDKICV